MQIEKVKYNGWENCLRLSNREMELIITTAVGPRVIRCGRPGGANLFAEIAGQQGGSGEKQWMIRGGHRLWIAPETLEQSYELDNTPVQWEEKNGAVLLHQPPGPVTGISKHMHVALAADRNTAVVRHILKNDGKRAVRVAPWALTVMAPGGVLIVPLPPKKPHGAEGCFTPNQTWSIWPSTDFADGRWLIGSRYLFFRQRPDRDAGKLGIAHREGWVAYQLPDGVFVKRFSWQADRIYPDGNVNFETFSNRDFLEVESLGPLTDLPPGAMVEHCEEWELLPPLSAIECEADVDAVLLPSLRGKK